MTRTKIFAAVALCLVGCGFETLVGDSNDGTGPGGEWVGGSAVSSDAVCVYKANTNFVCSDGTDTYDSTWECSSIGNLESCRAAFEDDISCTDSCCIDATFYWHQVIDAPCEIAIAHANSEGSDVRLTGEGCGITTGRVECDGCMNANCAGECSACADDPSCLLVFDCVLGCEDVECWENCQNYYASGWEKLLTIAGEGGCVDTLCPAECD